MRIMSTFKSSCNSLKCHSSVVYYDVSDKLGYKPFINGRGRYTDFRTRRQFIFETTSHSVTEGINFIASTINLN